MAAFRLEVVRDAWPVIETLLRNMRDFDKWGVVINEDGGAALAWIKPVYEYEYDLQLYDLDGNYKCRLLEADAELGQAMPPISFAAWEGYRYLYMAGDSIYVKVLGPDCSVTQVKSVAVNDVVGGRQYDSLVPVLRLDGTVCAVASYYDSQTGTTITYVACEDGFYKELQGANIQTARFVHAFMTGDLLVVAANPYTGTTVSLETGYSIGPGLALTGSRVFGVTASDTNATLYMCSAGGCYSHQAGRVPLSDDYIMLNSVDGLIVTVLSGGRAGVYVERGKGYAYIYDSSGAAVAAVYDGSGLTVPLGDLIMYKQLYIWGAGGTDMGLAYMVTAAPYEGALP